MKQLICLLIFGLLSISISAQTIESADGVPVEINDVSKIITIGGSITETVHVLGMWDNVIATDESSTFPPQVFRMPRVPYVRNLTSEGVLSLEADLIIASDDASPVTVIQQIRDANTPIILIKEEESLDGVTNKLKVIGEIFGKEEQAASIINETTKKYNHASELRNTLTSTPKVMFVLQARSGSFMAAGNDTGAEKMIELAGGTNVFDSFYGYKPVTNEAILAANPDYILVMQSRLEEVESGFRNTDGVNLITAVKKNQFVAMDGNALLGFGPRFGDAILELMKELHAELDIEF